MKKIIFMLFLVISAFSFSETNLKLREYVIKKCEGTTAYGKDLYNLIEFYSEVYEIETELMIAVIEIESNFNPLVKSPKGAMGLMQLMPQTAEELGVDAEDIDDNLRGGARYLKMCLNKNNDDIALALAAYNSGLGNVAKYETIPPFEETQNYVAKIVKIYNNLSGKNYIFNKVEFNSEGLEFKKEEDF